MVQVLIDRAWTKLSAIFPERHVYIRSEGRARFFTLSSSFQATCAGLCLLVLGWAVFTSVNVVFKDHIVDARDRHDHRMQGAYENRVADLQGSRRAVNGALVSAEDRFRSTVDQLAAKQRVIARLIRGKSAAENLARLPDARTMPERWFATGKAASYRQPIGAASDSVTADDARPLHSPGYSPPVSSAIASQGSGSSELGIMPQPVESQPRTARPVQASLFGGALLELFHATAPAAFSVSRLRTPEAGELSMLARQTRRAARISSSETALVVAFDAQLVRQIGVFKATLAQAGVRGPVGRAAAIGGPTVVRPNNRIGGISDSAFLSAYADAVARETQLDALKFALAHVPLAMPVQASQFAFSSGFGLRIDPFSRHLAPHTGVDLAGPWGASVYSTAAGVVVWAGVRGGYGNMVEIDHGYGFRTRYGHLSAIFVRPGERVEAGALVGRVGSTGRSTGPHLHYEVWLADTARDPDKYLELGRRLYN